MVKNAQKMTNEWPHAKTNIYLDISMKVVPL